MPTQLAYTIEYVYTDEGEPGTDPDPSATRPGKIPLPEGYMGYWQDGEVHILESPFKEGLEAYGETCRSASLKGRLVNGSPVLCLNCGEIYNRKHMWITGFFRPAPAFLLLIAVAVCIVIFTPIHWVLALFVAWISTFAACLTYLQFMRRYLMLRHADRQAAYDDEGCPKCDGKEYLSPVLIDGEGYIQTLDGKRLVQVFSRPVPVPVYS